MPRGQVATGLPGAELSRATASSPGKQVVDGAAYVGGNHVDWAVCIQHYHARRIGFRDREETVAYLAMEFGALALETIGAAARAFRARARALQPGLDLQIEHDSQIGCHVVGREPVQLAQHFEIDAACVAL